MFWLRNKKHGFQLSTVSGGLHNLRHLIRGCWIASVLFCAGTDYKPTFGIDKSILSIPIQAQDETWPSEERGLVLASKGLI